jgi:mannose-1-phosphate guanylyltransferase
MAFDEEIEVVQELVAVTEKSLAAQKELLIALVKLKQARSAFIEDPTSRKLATDVVKAAMLVQRQIENEHLAHLFSSDFLTEIQFYNQLGKKPKP